MAHKPVTQEEFEQGYMYSKLALTWSGWGSPVGLGIGLMSVGVFLWLLHAANIIK